MHYPIISIGTNPTAQRLANYLMKQNSYGHKDITYFNIIESVPSFPAEAYRYLASGIIPEKYTAISANIHPLNNTELC